MAYSIKLVVSKCDVKTGIEIYCHEVEKFNDREIFKLFKKNNILPL